MSAKTNNIYGRIVISTDTIKRFVSHIALDCYGIVKFDYRDSWDAIVSFFKFNNVKGVKINAVGNRIDIDLSVVVKYGVSIKAVVDALKESIKYKVEHFTGMIVDIINVNVIGVSK